MKEKLLALWTKVVTTVQENKETVIRVGGVAAGIVIGAVATSIVASMQEDNEMSITDADEADIPNYAE